MNTTPKRKQLHITLSPAHWEKLRKMKEKVGFSSSSQVVEFLIMENSISSRIDKLIRSIERLTIHKHNAPEGIPGVFKGSDLKVIKHEESA